MHNPVLSKKIITYISHLDGLHFENFCYLVHQHCDCSLPVPQHHVEQRRNPPDISHFNLTPDSDNVYVSLSYAHWKLVRDSDTQCVSLPHQGLCPNSTDSRLAWARRINTEYSRPHNCSVGDKEGLLLTWRAGGRRGRVHFIQEDTSVSSFFGSVCVHRDFRIQIQWTLRTGRKQQPPLKGIE